MKLTGFKAKDIGIDLGTTNVIITLKGKGIVLNEPSVIAVDVVTKEILATGFEAREMLGRTPKGIQAIRPLQDGVIADFNATGLMLKKMLQKICQRYNISKPRVMIGVPSEITEVEERAVEECVIQAGAKEAYVIEEPMATAIGSNLEVSEPTGNIVVDIGGGTTEVAVISLGGIVINNSLKIAGDKLDEDIVNYIKKEVNLAIGKNTAEEIKNQLGCAILPMSEESMQISGRDLITGLPQTLTITSTQIYEAMKESLLKIVEVVKQTLEKTPPELASDIMEKGIYVSGGGALIQDIDALLAMETKMPVYIVENPLECVAKGIEKVLEDLEKLRNILTSSRKKR